MGRNIWKVWRTERSDIKDLETLPSPRQQSIEDCSVKANPVLARVHVHLLRIWSKRPLVQRCSLFGFDNVWTGIDLRPLKAACVIVATCTAMRQPAKTY